MEYAKASGADWVAAKAAAGVKGRGTVAISTPDGEVAYMHWGDVENRFGQRIDTHNYPILGGYWQQPLSSEVNRFSVTGWIVGPKYLEARDQLSKVLHAKHDSDSPLILSLPTYEPLAVLFKSGSQKENGKQGGFVELSLQFERVLDLQPNIEVIDVFAAKEEARSKALNALAKDAKHTSTWNSLVGLLSTLKSGVNMAKSSSAELGRTILELQVSISQASKTPGEIINSFGNVLSTLVTAVAATPGELEREARRLQRYFLSWADYQLPGAAVNSAALRARNNTTNLLRTLGAIGTAENLLLLKPVSIDDARGLFAHLEYFEASLVLPSGDLVKALEAVRIAVREQLRPWFVLAAEQRIQISGTGLPSISLARELGSEEARIRKLNSVQNAFFISGDVRYV